jgi:hypothetical protein
VRMIALEFDGRGASGSDILLAVGWHTDPRRNAVLGHSDVVCAIEIYESHEVVWNAVTTERLHKLSALNEEAGREVAASVVYDNVKSSICFESYGRLKESIFVPPKDKDHYRSTVGSIAFPSERLDIKHKIFYDSSNLDKIVSEYYKNEARMNELKMPHSDIDFRVKQIVDQTVSSRLTSVFFESAEMRARMQAERDHIADRLAAQSDYNARMEKKMDSLISALGQKLD